MARRVRSLWARGVAIPDPVDVAPVGIPDALRGVQAIKRSWRGPLPQRGYYAVRTPDAVTYWLIPPGMDLRTVAQRVKAAHPGCSFAICEADYTLQDYGPAGIDPDPVRLPVTLSYVLHNLVAHPALGLAAILEAVVERTLALAERLHARIPEQ